ncbi:MAG: hypothetical protein KatS3mg110_3081 [Pirellulaceae bacterium]|nr:MAG: hypothetical protein KatS3mg110_3081 [Pirellulaceae bacterium]
MVLRIANAAGFWGDDLQAARRLLAHAHVDFLTLEYLAELTMSILASQRARDPARGYATDFLEVLRSVVSYLHVAAGPRIITNAGGVHPVGCAQAAARILSDHGLDRMAIGCVTGDDLTGKIGELLAAGEPLAHLETGQPLVELKRPIVAAHVYLGAEPIVRALEQGADVVITGRVADASLTVAPAVRHYRWSWNDLDRLAGATVAGHLIECGAQVTGGYSVRWQEWDLDDIGYPIAEIAETGEVVITKPPESGGKVDRFSVIEQLVYEIDDPTRYITPDVIVDFTSVAVEDLGCDRVAVRGARGQTRPEHLKVALVYEDGFSSAAQLVVAGRGCLAKAQRCAELVVHRLQEAGCGPTEVHVEYWGAGEYLGQHQPPDPGELVLRIAVWDRRREIVERFTREVAPLITSGPAGIGGYASGRSPVRPVFAYWPTLVPRPWIEPHVEVRSAADWLVDHRQNP